MKKCSAGNGNGVCTVLLDENGGMGLKTHSRRPLVWAYHNHRCDCKGHRLMSFVRNEN